ncbi:MAG TPA: oligosaccharyl transferase, archaeosortase A system-associated [Methanocorpusculum sp.]|nr:oligosaccharyl transferase, archaeosortase A system-associated [Methanocorpusculum sp.]
MNLSFWNNRRFRYGTFGGLVLLFTLLAFWIRILPFSDLVGSGDMIAGPDAWYNLRLIEVALANDFGFLHFEPMTLYPTGQDIVWGPLFTWISAVVVALSGAVTRSEIIDAAGWVPALMGAAMVPIMYWFGSQIGNWKTGLASALFIAIIGGQYLSRSLYGYLDHHIAETLFSTLFCLLYVKAIRYTLTIQNIDFKEISTMRHLFFYGFICGLSYLLGIFTMSTMVVFGLFVAIFVLFQFIINHRSGKPTEPLLVLNVITFVVVTIGLLVYGIQSFDFSLYSYSIGIFFAHLCLVFGPIALYIISRIFTKKHFQWYYYPISLVFLFIIAVSITAIVAPLLFTSVIDGLNGFFATNTAGSTIAEMASWSMHGAFTSFGFGLFLAIGGFIIILSRVWKHVESGALFVLIWSTLMIFATMQHIRWEYYVAVNIALLAAVFVGLAFTFAEEEILQLFVRQTRNESGHSSIKSSTKISKNKPAGLAWFKVGACSIIIVIAIAFVVTSTVTAIQIGENYAKYGGTEKNWMSECTWMLSGTPDPGLNYFSIYAGDNFEYPLESYGVMSWWDYGHYITTIAERPPNCNPFQAGVSGLHGAAAVLTSTNESDIMEKLNFLGTRYVMTDYRMAGSKFGAIAIWSDPVSQLLPYYYTFLQPDNNGKLSCVIAKTSEYYNTFIVRLQYYDGSMTSPGELAVVETDSSADYLYPVITAFNTYTTEDVSRKVADMINTVGPAWKHAYVIANPQTLETAYLPNTVVPALQHFRLVHESPDYVMANGQHTNQKIAGGIACVKSFEYVRGAIIRGDGIIEVNVITNNGRTFTYRQASVDGKFVVPYSTFGGRYDVVTTGPYTIVGTNKTFEVSELAVMRGLLIN